MEGGKRRKKDSGRRPRVLSLHSRTLLLVGFQFHIIADSHILQGKSHHAG
jgi:hypothetical protein